MIVNRLPYWMDRKKISIRQLSRRTGITYTTIRAVYHSERRSVQLEVLDAICQVLDIQPGDIYISLPEGQAATEELGASDNLATDRAVESSSDQAQEPGARISLIPDSETGQNTRTNDWKSW